MSRSGSLIADCKKFVWKGLKNEINGGAKCPRHHSLTYSVLCCFLWDRERVSKLRPTLRAAPPPETSAQTRPPVQTQAAGPGTDSQQESALKPRRTSPAYDLARVGSGRLGSAQQSFKRLSKQQGTSLKVGPSLWIKLTYYLVMKQIPFILNWTK